MIDPGRNSGGDAVAGTFPFTAGGQTVQLGTRLMARLVHAPQVQGVCALAWAAVAAIFMACGDCLPLVTASRVGLVLVRTPRVKAMPITLNPKTLACQPPLCALRYSPLRHAKNKTPTVVSGNIRSNTPRHSLSN